MTLSHRIHDLEASVAGLVDDLETALWLGHDFAAPNEWLRIYIVREKLNAIIAGDNTEVYDIAWKKWNMRFKETDDAKSA